MSPERKKSDEVLLKLPNARPGVRSTKRGSLAGAAVPPKAAAANPGVRAAARQPALKKTAGATPRAAQKPAAKSNGKPATKSALKPATKAKSTKPVATGKNATGRKSSRATKPSTAKPRQVAEPKLRIAQRIAPPPGPPPIDNRRRDEVINAGLHAFGEVAAVGVRSVGRVTKKLLGR